MAEEVFQIIYVSRETRRMTDADLEEILTLSRSNNAEQQVTGMLLYSDGSFIQVLEGPQDGVREIFDLIQMDDRHTDILVLTETYVEGRAFPDWKMGFERVERPDIAQRTGVSDFLDAQYPLHDGLGKRQGVAYSLLMSFRSSTSLRRKPKAG